MCFVSYCLFCFFNSFLLQFLGFLIMFLTSPFLSRDVRILLWWRSISIFIHPPTSILHPPSTIHQVDINIHLPTSLLCDCCREGDLEELVPEQCKQCSLHSWMILSKTFLNLQFLSQAQIFKVFKLELNYELILVQPFTSNNSEIFPSSDKLCEFILINMTIQRNISSFTECQEGLEMN